MAAIKQERFKILILGESNVGKTSILQRFISDTFTYSIINTVGINYSSKEIVINGESLKLQIWDTAGQERFHSITKNYYRNANGIFLVFSMIDDRSFDCIDKWYEGIVAEVGNDIPIFLIGNKYDLLDDMNDIKRFETKATNMNLRFFPTSALQNKNIDKIFLEMGERMLKIGHKMEKKGLNVKSKKKKYKCC
ncbi:Rab GTPase [Spraguea lophii 42_110]|uniref:Rab GTPase n=1 Tax=Spraguea lophii (strain 42_110) TaxID=1358809 RepID=S7XH31_SPRLO|nr:Rab GTPase [Spraguea lophii 42_110]